MSNMFGRFKEIIGLGEYDEEFEELEEVEEEEEVEEVEPIISKQRGNKIVLVNTTSMETKIAQRLVDFISGACCVLGAQLQEVEQRVYLLSPSNVEVSNELRSEISSKALFNWNK